MTLQEFIKILDAQGDLLRITTKVDTNYEMCEIVDRISKSKDGGKAVLFENSGTDYPVLMNMMGSDKRMATALGVSTSHLSRILSGKGGLGFSNLLNSLRCYEAQRLLLQTDLSISQIAFEAGYGSIRNFNRVFQKYFHCLPKNLRAGRG